MERFLIYDNLCKGNRIEKLINNKVKKLKELIKGDILLNGSMVKV